MRSSAELLARQPAGPWITGLVAILGYLALCGVLLAMH
jgi:hypothetical protein